MTFVRSNPQRNFQDVPFVGRVLSRVGHPGWPLAAELAWRDRALDSVTGEFDIDSPRFSGPDPDTPHFPAALLVPPAGQLTPATASDGRPLYGYQAVVHVVAGRITAVSGALNASYDVRSLDDAIQENGLTPIDRWAGVNWTPKAVGDACQLMIMDAETVLLIAWESPELVSCPAPSAATGGTVEATSFLGIG